MLVMTQTEKDVEDDAHVLFLGFASSRRNFGGTRQRSSLRHYATSWKVVGSSPD
jgi:hypothetical protein